MSSRISFEGIGEVVATFVCGEEVQAGQTVGITGDGTVGTCGDGQRFCGVALSADDGYAAVQIGGLVKVDVSGEGVAPGWCKLSGDGAGGVRLDTSGGTDYLVVRSESSGAVVRL